MLDDAALDTLFREARTHYSWLDKPISDDVLHKLYDTIKFGPTAANSNPARFVFIRTTEGKERLRPALAPANVEKSMTAAVVVIVAYDLLFYEKMPKLFPHNPGMRNLYATNPQLVETTARRNSTLQGAYLLLGARALGLDAGPMSGFDNAKLDEIFFAAGEECDGCEQEFFPKGHVRSNFLINLGYGNREKIHPRLPRLDFGEACLLA
ncbi:MAG: malonic semialdehyde reductase [Thermoanaerobaculia bacterium]